MRRARKSCAGDVPLPALGNEEAYLLTLAVGLRLMADSFSNRISTVLKGDKRG